MKTVSREKAKELKNAGWKRETENVNVLFITKWMPAPWAHREQFGGWLPTPTIDELLEDLIFDDFKGAFCHKDPGEATLNHFKSEGLWHSFAVWLYVTMCDPDKLADVWIERERRKV